MASGSSSPPETPATVTFGPIDDTVRGPHVPTVSDASAGAAFNGGFCHDPEMALTAATHPQDHWASVPTGDRALP